ncbi:MAG TPA: hypothetical protein VL738_01350 [Dactylosporangium sp.]|nr:hypothetical protein [Dactylosporangium sp.]
MTDPSSAYRSVVGDIIAARPTAEPPPDAPDLRISRRRQPQTVADLLPAEVEQLRAVWHDCSLDDVLADEEYEVEAAEVVDAAGIVRFRLYGWNYGVGYLFPPEGLAVVASGAQHDIEHWRLEQRPLFAAMDRALRAGGHGFSQPLHFCWTDDTCWDEIAGAEPGTVGSEPYLRALFGA